MAEILKFPKGFTWGTATSAYQIEGAAHEEGREDSIWDVFCRIPGKILDGASGDTAADHYHRWKEDVALMAALGIKSYRFSLSWPRIAPNGKPNSPGIAFYDRLIDELLKNGIKPAITLYHWDLPQHLQAKGGWISRNTIQAFVEYAGIAFSQYSDRVKLWMTHNEPAVVVSAGYSSGFHAPGIQNSEDGVIAAHHLLLSHGAALKHMRALGGSKFKGKVGIVLNMSAIYPENPSNPDDQTAANYIVDSGRGFYLDGLFKGTYPKSVLKEFPILRKTVHKGDMELINGHLDFLGINYYTKTVVQGLRSNGKIIPNYIPPTPNPCSSMWSFCPEGLKDVLTDVWEKYRPREILITENGTAVDDVLSENGVVNDPQRITYIREHLKVLHGLIESGIPITGYYAWSLIDNFEWNYGYQKRFGLVYVDYPTQQRIIKASGHWYRKVIQDNAVVIP